jgi:hypothetical protein
MGLAQTVERYAGWRNPAPLVQRLERIDANHTPMEN